MHQPPHPPQPLRPTNQHALANCYSHANGACPPARGHQDVPRRASKVVHTHHPGVWDGEDLVPEVIRQMLDASITGLTGLNDAREAWAALFRSEERVAIKVNTIGSGIVGITHIPLVVAVAECLQAAGIPAEQIVIFDRYTKGLRHVGYPINQDGPGVRCYGIADDWDDWKPGSGWEADAYLPGGELLGRDIGLSNILLNCNALINMPILKDHDLAGITFAMKNHYGTLDTPEYFHETIQSALAELNALPPIKDRTRLVIGDVLNIASWQVSTALIWDVAITGDSILRSFDPVATDTVGLQLYLDAWPSGNPDLDPTTITDLATPWLENAAKLGVGANDPDKIDVVEMS